MKKALVFQLNDRAYARYLHDCIKPDFVPPAFPHAYELVAVVDVEGPGDACLDKAYELTNNIDTNWTQNDGVVYCGPYDDGHRSTSPGDVIVIDNNIWRCENAGWTPINATEPGHSQVHQSNRTSEDEGSDQ